MLKNKLISVFLLSLLFLAGNISFITAQSLSFLDESVTYLWPTDSSRQLSSTFAETRSAHLHAGLDIRTFGREGYNVFATRDGVVYRVAMGPRGYGNVIFLKHNDDSFSVYAHLNRFEPNLQAYVDSLRLLDYTFEFDKNLEHKNFTYEQGDVIAFTGSTGIGPPHLHFELRTPEFKPFNPLLTNLGVRDNIPPVFRQLGIEKLDSETLHLNGHDIYNARRTANGYDFGTVDAGGPVGLSVNVHDRANQTPNVYAVHTLTMVHESDTLFHSKADYFPHKVSGHMFLDRSYPILAQTRRGFQRLYTVSGNNLPFYEKVQNKGILNFPQGTYPIRIIASDIYGNETTATVNLRFTNTTQLGEISHVPVYPRLIESETARRHFLNRIEMGKNIPLLTSIDDNTALFLRRQTPVTFSSLRSVRKKLTPNKKSILQTPDQRLWVQFPAVALYDSLELQMDISQSANEIRISFEPNRLPIDGSIQLNYILPDNFKDNERLAVFSVDEFRGREYLMPSTNSNGVLRTSLREINNIIIKEDRTPPWVGRPRLEKNLAGNYIIKVPTRDDMTGIDYRKSTITVNGNRGIIEYDPEKNFLIYYHPEYKPRGSNKVDVRVFDGAGNSTIRSESFTY